MWVGDELDCLFRQILTTLVEGVSKPVTCKIRILPTVCEEKRVKK